MSQISLNFDAPLSEPEVIRAEKSAAFTPAAAATIRDLITIGVDEVGRGCIAGPIAACAFYFSDESKKIEGLRDSKKLTDKARERLEPILEQHGVFCYAEASAEEIDELGINEANFRAMQRAIAGLDLVDPSKYRVIVDGNQMPPLGHLGLGDVQCIVKADDLVPAVSAASVLAKVKRDRLMAEAAVAYPGYGFEGHAGYPTPKHITAVAELGATVLHRMSFAPLCDLQPAKPKRPRP